MTQSKKRKELVDRTGNGLPVLTRNALLRGVRFKTLVEAVIETTRAEGGAVFETVSFTCSLHKAEKLKRLIKEAGGKDAFLERILCLVVEAK